jgi:hypothetical protein
MSTRTIDRFTDVFVASGGVYFGTAARTIAIDSSGKVECMAIGRATSVATGMVYARFASLFRCYYNGMGVPTVSLYGGTIIGITGDLPAWTVQVSFATSGLTIYPQVSISPSDGAPGYEFFVDVTFVVD